MEKLQDQEPLPENFEEEEEEYYRPSLPGWMSWVADPVLLVTLSLVFAVDQITKAIVRSNLLMGQSIPFDGPVRITHWRWRQPNPGRIRPLPRTASPEVHPPGTLTGLR